MYQAGESRNYKYTLEHYALEDFRPHVHCYLHDVVQAYKCLIEHMPMFDDGAHHPLFLGPNKDKIWFLKIHVDNSTLGQLSKCLTKDLELIGKKFKKQIWA